MSQWGTYDFDAVIEDQTKKGTKIKRSDYLDCGLFPIIDQGQELITGYTNMEEGLYTETPVIIFGDHTRILKYIDTPFFLGADGVKIIKTKGKDLDYKFLYYFFLKNEIPNTGYNRHFKWLKELKIPLPPIEI
ncbi:MAG: restriction endonuclease subunit S [Acetobacterium sp.]